MDRALWRLAVVTTAGTFMALLDTSIVNVALHRLELTFGASVAQLQWVVTAYILTMATVIPLSGWAARRFGPRQVYVTSLAVFTAGSALCGAAWSVESLVAFRVVQALGGAMLVPVGMMIMAHAAGPERLARAMSVTSVPVMLAPVLGPVIGGFLLDGLGWRWIFLVNVPLGIAALTLALRRLPRGERLATEPLDVRGALLLAFGLPAMTYALAEIGEGASILSPAIVFLTVLGPLLIILFVVHALRRERPLVDVRVFRNATFRSSALCGIALTGTVFGSLILLPLYFQQVRGLDALMTGVLLMPQGLATAFAPTLTARFVDRFGGGRVVFVGILISVAGTVPLAFIGAQTPFAVLVAVLAVRGFGNGMAMVPVFASAMRTLRPDQITDASTQLQLVVRVGGSLGTTIFAVLLGRALTGAQGAAAQAEAFAATFSWVAGATLFALVPATVLVRVEARRRRSIAAPHVDPPRAEIA